MHSAIVETFDFPQPIDDRLLPVKLIVAQIPDAIVRKQIGELLGVARPFANIGIVTIQAFELADLFNVFEAAQSLFDAQFLHDILLLGL